MKLGLGIFLVLMSVVLSSSSYAHKEVKQGHAVGKPASLEKYKKAKQTLRLEKERHGGAQDLHKGYKRAVKVIMLLPVDIKSGEHSYYKLYQAQQNILKKLRKSPEAQPYLNEVLKFIHQNPDVFMQLKKYAKHEKKAMDMASQKYRREVLGARDIVQPDEPALTMVKFAKGKKIVREGLRNNDRAMMNKAFNAFRDTILAAPDDMRTGLYPFYKLQGAVQKSLKKLEKYGEESKHQYQEALTFIREHEEEFQLLKLRGEEDLIMRKAAAIKYRHTIGSVRERVSDIN